MASTVATAARYCMKTTGRIAEMLAGGVMTVDIMSAPCGDTQTLEPRPRPATWVVAVKVKPVGSVARSFGFLWLLSQHSILSVHSGAVEAHFSRTVLVLVTTSPYMNVSPQPR